MAQITASQLKTKIEKCYSAVLCKKNTAIKQGKSVDKYNRELSRLYNYWGGNNLNILYPSLIDSAITTITQTQIDLILKEILSCDCNIELSDLA